MKNEWIVSDSSRDSSRECCVCNFMQVEMLNCYSKPTDEAFVVFRSIEHAPEVLPSLELFLILS